MDKDKFKKLQAEWYAKAKKSGFNDIETKSGELINTLTSAGAIDPRKINWKEDEEFYRLGRYFLNDYKFKTKLEKRLWQYYIEDGLSIRDCVKKNNSNRSHTKTDRQSCWEIIVALREEMKKMYGVTAK